MRPVSKTSNSPLYAILGVEANASIDEIKAAYRKASRANHPDMVGDDDWAAARFRAINEAYEILSDPTQRAAYDYSSGMGSAPAYNEPVPKSGHSEGKRPSDGNIHSYDFSLTAEELDALRKKQAETENAARRWRFYVPFSGSLAAVSTMVAAIWLSRYEVPFGRGPNPPEWLIVSDARVQAWHDEKLFKAFFIAAAVWLVASIVVGWFRREIKITWLQYAQKPLWRILFVILEAAVVGGLIYGYTMHPLEMTEVLWYVVGAKLVIASAQISYALWGGVGYIGSMLGQVAAVTLLILTGFAAEAPHAVVAFVTWKTIRGILRGRGEYLHPHFYATTNYGALAQVLMIVAAIIWLAVRQM